MFCLLRYNILVIEVSFHLVKHSPHSFRIGCPEGLKNTISSSTAAQV